FDNNSRALPDSPPEICSLANTSIFIRPSVSSSISSANFSAPKNHVEDSLVVTDMSRFNSSSPDELSSASPLEHALISNKTPNAINMYFIFFNPNPPYIYKLQLFYFL